MHRSVRFPGVVAVIVAAVAIAIPASPAPVRAATEHTVDISGFAFGPATLTIAVGDTVTWTNSDDAPHTASAEDDAFDSGNLDSGQSFSFTFTQPGTYQYRCDYHSQMTGTIVVEAAAEQPAASTAPSTAQQPAASAAPSDAANPDTALPGVGGPSGLPSVLMGLGLLVVALSLFRFSPARSARVRREGGGWNR